MSAANALGVKTTSYEYKGTTYTLSEFTLEDYGKYELSLEETGWAALKRARHFQWITEFEYKEMVREWLALLATHQLSFGSPDYIKSTQTLPGVRKMLELSLRHKHGEIDPKLIDEMTRTDVQSVIEAISKLDATDDTA